MKIPKPDSVDKAGMKILQDMHHAEKEHTKRPEPKAKPEGEAKPRFSRQTNFFIALTVIALIFITIFAIKLLSRPEILTPDEMHAKNLAGELDPEIAYVYRGFSFVFYDNLWFTQMHKPGTTNLYNVELHFGPRDLSNVTLGPEVELFSRVPNTYVTFDAEQQDLTYIALAAGELSLNLAVVLNMTPVAACTRNETAACRSRPIVNCESDFTHPIIYLRKAEQPAVRLDGNCLVIEGTQMDIVRATDRVLLLWMDIMPRDAEESI